MVVLFARAGAALALAALSFVAVLDFDFFAIVLRPMLAAQITERDNAGSSCRAGGRDVELG
jgi:hypothetical protein